MKTKTHFLTAILLLGSAVTGYGQSYGSGAQTNTCGAGAAGTANTLFGCGAGNAVNANGNHNSYYGDSAGYATTYSNGNTAIGARALRTMSYANSNNAYNSYNTAVGFQALYFNQPTSSGNGNYNTAVGYRAGYTNTTGNYNIFVGGAAGHYNTTGYFSVYIGYTAGYRNSTGYHNTFLGHQAGHENTTGFSNTYLGLNAGYENTTGSQNTAVGNLAGDSYAADTNCTFLGYGADVNATAYKNTTVIGHSATGTASNQMRLGNANITTMFCHGAYAATTANAANMTVLSTGQILRSTSSARYKKDIVDLEVNTANIYKLRPVSYTSTSVYDNNMRQFGLIAEEVAKVIPELAYYTEEKNVVPGSTSDKLIPDAVQYSLLPVLLLKEVQKHEATIAAQEKTIDGLAAELETQAKAAAEQTAALQAENAQMKNDLEAIRQQLDRFDNALAQCCLNYEQGATPGKAAVTTTGTDVPSLQQNAPNPFRDQTVIRYYIPRLAGKAMLKIVTMAGVELQAVELTQKGAGEYTIAGNTLAAGSYYYVLLIDGKKVDSKVMVLSK